MARLQDQMFTGKDFVFSVSRDFVRTLPTPLLVLSGTDAFHPSGTSKEIVRHRIIAEIIRATHPRWSELRHDMCGQALLAPNCELIADWKSPEVIAGVTERAEAFMLEHGASCLAANL